jgi:hypothetical protein
VTAPLPNFEHTIVALSSKIRSGVTLSREWGLVYGEHIMTRLVIDLLLFSCMFAVVTGIVIAAANFLL